MNQLPKFTTIAPLAADLCRGVPLSGTIGLRLTANGDASGLVVPGGYLRLAMLVWVDSAVSRCYLFDGARTTGFALGFHTDPVNNGNPALVFGVNDGNSGNAYGSRFEVDLRSAPGQATLRSIEIEYIQGAGTRCWVDGDELLAAATGGTDNGIGSGAASNTAIGCSSNGNTLYYRLAPNIPSVVGDQSKWPSGGGTADAVGCLNGGIAYCYLERSPGIPVLDLPLNGDVVDRVDTQAVGVNHPSSGSQWLPAGTAAPTFSLLIPWILTDTDFTPLEASEEFTVSEGAPRPVTVVRLWNPSSSAFACSGFAVTEVGRSRVKRYLDSSGSVIADFAAASIPAGSYIDAEVEQLTDTVGEAVPSSVQWSSTGASETVSFLVTTLAASAAVVPFLSGLRVLRLNVSQSTQSLPYLTIS